MAHARNNGKPHGRPATAKKFEKEIRILFQNGLSQSAIAKKLGIGRTSVRRILSAQAQK
ncbi:helix-turn-helix domain-containing protein [Legionella pneumophila]|uniref:helix-turn-helix domain-containing protein n=1 Tax=Legionella pneumophila TaxID=446 RepID=UPI003A4C53FA